MMPQLDTLIELSAMAHSPSPAKWQQRAAPDSYRHSHSSPNPRQYQYQSQSQRQPSPYLTAQRRQQHQQLRQLQQPQYQHQPQQWQSPALHAPAWQQPEQSREQSTQRKHQLWLQRQQQRQTFSPHRLQRALLSERRVRSPRR